jgi:hypothetical protein
VTIEPPAGVAGQQLEQIDTTRDRFRDQFPIATFTSRGRVEQPLEGAGDHPDATQFDCLADIGGRLQCTGDSSVHEEEIDGGRAKLKFLANPVFLVPSPGAGRA